MISVFILRDRSRAEPSRAGGDAERSLGGAELGGMGWSWWGVGGIGSTSDTTVCEN